MVTIIFVDDTLTRSVAQRDDSMFLNKFLVAPTNESGTGNGVPDVLPPFEDPDDT